LLAEARERDLSDSFVLSGTSAKFSITFDLAWKVMKDILVQYYAITGFVTGSPREVLKQSFQAKLITGDEWIELAHDYDGVIVKEHCQTIIHLYIDKLYDFNIIYSKNSPSSTGGRWEMNCKKTKKNTCSTIQFMV
jgi:nucleotidyltransferase substrate binding protein (TIGR01987 family)